jgi:error-prone DNA polymerase
VFSKLRAFAAYGFCKAHAASFAKIAYQTAYLKTHYPAEFLAGILNNEPMGFYPANVITEEARRLGIRILPVDINRSGKKFVVEYEEGVTGDRLQVTERAAPGIRIALSQVKGISDAEVDSILSARSEVAGDRSQVTDEATPDTRHPSPDTHPFSSFPDFCSRTHCDRPTIENLINCGAFDSFGIQRGKLLWMVSEVDGRRSSVGRKSTQPMMEDNLQSSIFNLQSDDDFDEQIRLLPDVPEPTLHERVRMDYEILGLSSICHPMLFYREKLAKARIVKSSEIKDLPNNTIVRTAGVVVVCMRPPTKSGVIVVFLTLEDEDGLADCVVFPKVYEQYGKVIFNNPALIVEGKLDKSGKHGRSIIVRKVRPLTPSYRTDSTPLQPFTERRRIAGHRSFVRSVGV